MYHAVPTTLQMQAADCGAASLKMLLESLGQKFTLEEVRNSIGVGRDGSTIGDIKRASISLGIELEAHRIEKEKIWFVTPPCIIWWNSNHFVVYEGTQKNDFFINDPAVGRRELSEVDFISQFTGVIINPACTTFPSHYISPNIIKNGSLFNFFFYSSLKPVLLAIALSVSAVVPTVLSAQIASYFIDTTLGQSEFITALPLLWLLFLFSGIITLVNFLSFEILSRTAYVSTIAKTLYFIRSILNRPFPWFANRQVSELTTRIMIPPKGVSSFVYEMSAQIGVLISTILVIVFLIIASWQLGVFCLFIILITIYFAYTINSSVENQNRLVSIEAGKQQGLALTTLSEIDLVRPAGLENQRFATWAGYYTNYVNAQVSVSNSLSYISLISNSAFYILNVGLLVIGPILIIHRSISLGNFISISYLMGIVCTGITTVPSILASFQNIVAPIDRLRDVFEAPSDFKGSQHNASTTSIGISSGPSALAFENVFFEFTPNNKIFNNLNFKIPLLGIIGIKGSPAIGKSILLQIIIGFYPLNSGNIKWHYKEGSASPSHVLSYIYLPQQPAIIQGTVLENITLKDNSISAIQAVNAASLSGLLSSETVAKALSPSKYLEFGGKSISGTIRQRLFLARAYAAASKNKILLIDNCLDQLDNEEICIHVENLRNLYYCVFVVLDNANYRACDFILDLSMATQPSEKSDL